MKKQRIVILMLGVLLFSAGLAKATLTNWDIYSDTTISSGNYGTVNIYDSQTTPPDQTTVTMTGGQAIEIIIYNNSNLILNAGTVSGFSLSSNSTATINNGIFNGANLFGNSKMYIHGGTWGIGNDVDIYIYDNAKLHIYGYQLEHDDAYYLYGRTLDAITGYWDLEHNQEFILVLSGPSVNNFTLYEIPEPTTLLLFTFGGLLLRRHHKRLVPI